MCWRITGAESGFAVRNSRFHSAGGQLPVAALARECAREHSKKQGLCVVFWQGLQLGPYLSDNKVAPEDKRTAFTTLTEGSSTNCQVLRLQ